MPQANPNARCDIYIANMSLQRWDFSYRMPGGKQARRQPIEVGKQIRVSGETTAMHAQLIMTQWAKYGLRDISEIDDARELAGLVMSRDKPASRENLLGRIALNKSILVERGREQRLAAGIATAAQIEEATGEALASLEFSVVEDEHSDKTEPTFAERINISRNHDPKKVTTRKERVTAGKVRRAAA